MTPWAEWLDASLSRLDEYGRLRCLRPVRGVDPVSPVHVERDGRTLVLFSSNDYLGLSTHPAVREAFATAAEEWGAGPRGSPLVCGYTDHHQALERRLARLKSTDEALLFPSGFAANRAVLGALGGSDGVAVFSDELNHASIVDGCRFARGRGAHVGIYPHLDLSALEAMLARSTADRKLIVTESVFSVDGDLAPLRRLVEIKEQHGAMLVVDEAHATLVFGDTGGGLAEHVGVARRVDVQVGTLSKAAGAIGGFVASDVLVRRWLLNRGRPYVFSTALPVPVVVAALKAIEVAGGDPSLRTRLWDRIEGLGRRLERDLAAPLLSWVLGEEEAAVAAERSLLDEGFHVVAIRPPTVPPGTSRLRITVSAAHDPDHLDGLAAVLRRFPAA